MKSRLAVAALLLGLAACTHHDDPPAPANCSIDQDKIRGLLTDAGQPAHVTLQHIDQEACAPDWVFARATFKQADGTPTEALGFLFHHEGSSWQMVYQGTGPLDPGDPRCTQVPAVIKQAPTFDTVCP